MALSLVHDVCIVDGAVVGEIKSVIEVTGRTITYHPYVKSETNLDKARKGIDTSQFSQQSLDRLKKIRHDCLHLFEESPGWKFRVKGTNLIDIVEGVDHELQMVRGRQYGDFHIDLCELTTSMQMANLN